MNTLLAQAIDFNKITDDLLKSPNLKDTNPVFLPGGAGNIAKIIDLILPYVFIIAGLLLLFYLIAGGFQMMTSPGEEKAVAAAKAKITSALIGFLLLFVSYWIVQAIQYILGFKVL